MFFKLIHNTTNVEDMIKENKYNIEEEMYIKLDFIHEEKSNNKKRKETNIIDFYAFSNEKENITQIVEQNKDEIFKIQKHKEKLDFEFEV